MEVNLPMIEGAIERLFDPNSGPAVSQQANAFLYRVQYSPEAWKLCWDLLAPEKDLKCHLIGSSMLHAKVCQGLNDLNDEQLNALRTKLVSALVTHAVQQTPQANQVSVKLAVTLSAFAARTLTAFWKSAVHDMIANLKSSHPLLLIEFLVALPDQNVKIEGPQSCLTPSVRDVLALCSSALADPALREVSMRAITQWVSLDSVESMPPDLCITLLNYVPHNHEAACDALVNCLTHPDWFRLPNTIAEILVQVISQCRSFINSAKAVGDQESLFSIYALLAGVGETHSSVILQSLQGEKRPAMEAFLQMLLECIGTPGYYPVDEILSRVPLTFWHLLLDDLSRLEVSAKGRVSLELHPVYEELVRLLLTKSRLPDHGSMDADEMEDHRCYRQDIADCYVYVHTLLSKSMFRYLIFELKSAVSSYNTTHNWKPIEACLFSLNAVGEMADGIEHGNVVHEVLDLLPQIPAVNDEVMSQVMTAIGIFAEKTSGQQIGPLVHLLLRGLQEPGISFAASMALKDLARAHAEHLAPVANDILQAIGIVLHPQSPLPLKHRDRVRLVAIVGHVVSALSSTDQALQSLTALMAPFVMQLSEMTNTFEVHPDLIDPTVENLDLLQSMFSSLSFQDGFGPSQSSKPGQHLVEQLAPLFSQIAAKYPTNTKVVNGLAECLRRAVPVLETTNRGPLLKQLLSLCCELQRAAPNAAVIECASSILTHAKVTYASELGEHLINLCDTCLKYFAHDLHERTDLVEAFYTMLASLLKKRATYFDGFAIETLLECTKCAILSTKLPETFTFRSVIQYLVQFVTASERIEILRKTLELCGEGIVATLIENMHGGVSRKLIEQEADVFLALNRSAFPLLASWLNRFLQVPEALPGVSQDSKTNFVRQILRERSNKRILTKVVSDFTVEWRRLEGEYGRATTAARI
ncbi:importin-13 [Galendromus occidentalis]|uniref:Importin-13 n=1 Tax=Galendromus occidentalis TaxID=34638 RepID=A0AAJ6QW82_9ACAR|nr:importin-13 [Galendromus occidentalis]